MSNVLKHVESYKSYKYIRDNVMAGAKTLEEANRAKEAMDGIYVLGIETAKEAYKLHKKNRNKKLFLFALGAFAAYKIYKHKKELKNEK